MKDYLVLRYKYENKTLESCHRNFSLENCIENDYLIFIKFNYKWILET